MHYCFSGTTWYPANCICMIVVMTCLLMWFRVIGCNEEIRNGHRWNHLFHITIYSQPRLHLQLTMVSIRTMEVKEGPRTFRSPSLLCFPHLSRTNEADSCSLSWNVPVVNCAWERQRQCHLHIWAHYRRKTKQTLQNQEKTSSKLSSQTNTSHSASKGNSTALIQLLFSVVIFKRLVWSGSY